MSKTINIFSVFFLLFSWFGLNAQPSGYSYGKKITIDNTKVSGSSSLTNFPVLISLTDNDLRTTANSGYVTSSNGYDIVFTNGNGTTIYSHEIEKYNASTGEFIAWVKVPTLSHNTNTEINMYYGNSSVSTNPSTTATWNTDYIVNMHMDDNPTGTIGNSSQQTFTATSVGSMTSGDIVAGMIGSATDFDGSNDGFKMNDNNSLDLNTNDFTFSCWFKTDIIGSNQVMFNKKPSGGGVTGFGQLSITSSGNISIYHKGSGTGQTYSSSSSTINTNTWYLMHAVCDVSSDNVEIFINGSSFANIAVDAGTTLSNGHKQFFGMYADYNANNHSGYQLSSFNGILDEMRIALTNQSSDWIATEYNNQNSPSSFYSLGSHQTASGSLPVNLTYFDVRSAINHSALLSWSTASEINNSHFEIERSYDGKTFDVVGEVAGNGNSQHSIEYRYTDQRISPSENNVFYRLKQLDFNGAFEYSYMRVVRFDRMGEGMHLTAYPNPFLDEITLMVSLPQGEDYSLEITDLKGAKVHQSNHTFTSGVHPLNLAKWNKGVYLVEVVSKQGSEHLKVMKK